jgi:hypothetical protein
MPDTRPPCDLCGANDKRMITQRVTAALARAGLEGEALVFAERIKDVPGTNALLQIARQYVRPAVGVGV